MKKNLELSETLTYHQGYRDYNIAVILLLYYKYPNTYIPFNQPVVTLRGRFTKQRMQWAPAQRFVAQSAREAKPLHCHAPAHWKSPSVWRAVGVESRILARGKTTLWMPSGFVLVTAAAVRSSGSVWFCVLDSCKQSGRHGPSLPCSLVFCNVYCCISVTVEICTFWWDKIIESSARKITLSCLQFIPVF